MDRRLTLLLTAVALAVAAAILIPLLRSSPAAPSGPGGTVGQSAPAFALRDDRGAPVSLLRERGRIVVMNLWASWCPPCREEMPDLQRLADLYRGREVAVIGVDQGESPQRARSFADSLGIHFPIWIDEREQYGRVYAALGLPTTVIVSRDGRVVRGFDGPLTFDQMRAAVGALAPR